MASIDAARKRGVGIAALAVLLTIGLGVGLAWLGIRPLLILEQQAKRVGEGDLDAELNLTLTPELKRLSGSFNDMVRGLRDRMELRRSLHLAMEVQQSLLPADKPHIAGLDIEGHSTYCDETGGDYYDFLEVTGLSDNSIGIVVGDVMGHGIAAAMLMATARGILQSRSRVPGSLADILTHLNELLVEVTEGVRFMTMLLLSFDVDDRCLRWASAGHGPPLVYDPHHDEFLDLTGGGLPLGLMEDAEYEEYEVRDLKPGTILLAATDGLWESQNSLGEEFGTDRVHDQIRSLHNSGAAAVSNGLHQSLQSFLGQVHQQDDVTFVTLRVEANDDEVNLASQ